MKHKTLLYALFPILGMSLLTISPVAASGMFGGLGTQNPDEIATHQQTLFQAEADILGVSVDDVKNAWADGKSLKQLADEKGISQDTLNTKLKEYQTNKLKTQLQALVSKGIITQAQADKRLTLLQSRLGKNNRGMGRQLFHGFRF